MSKADRKGATVALFAFLTPIVTVAVVATDMDPSSRSTLQRGLEDQLWVLLTGLAVLVGGVWYLTRTVLNDHDKAARRLATAARTAATANPQHRAEPTRKSEGLKAASNAVNALAERAERAERDVALRVDAARGEVAAERDRLASLIADMDHPLIMCTPDGLVLLLNEAARHACAREGFLGVGRSVFAVLDRDDLAEPVQRVLTGERVTAAIRCGSHVVQFRIGPISDSEGRATGFVLIGPPTAVPTAVRDAVGAAADHLQAAPRRPARPVAYDFGLLDVDESAPRGKENLRKIAYTVVDTETTGLNPLKGDRVVAVGAVRVDRGQVREDDVLDRLVDPRRPIPAEATAVHGITDDMVAGRPALKDVVRELARFAADTVLVGHDLAFDLAFLRPAAEKAGVELPTRVLDTLLLSALLHPHEDAHDLEALARRYGVAVLGRHTALGDALVTAELLVRMVDELAERGIITYGLAVAESTTTRRAQEGAQRF